MKVKQSLLMRLRRISVVAALLSPGLLLSGNVSMVDNAEARSAAEVVKLAEDCSDGVPRLGCQIWNVTIFIPPFPQAMECETGGEWKCLGD